MRLTLKRPAQAPAYRYDPREHGVTQSQLSCWLNCREKARLTIIHGLTPVSVSRPLVFGSLSHGGIMHALRAIRTGGRAAALAPILESVEANIAAAEAEVRKEWPACTELDEVIEEFAAILAPLHRGYWNRWHADDIKRKWIHVEDAFRVELTMPDGAIVPMVGKMDGSYYDVEGRFLLKETKNKSQWSAWLMDSLSQDLQCGYYLCGLDDDMPAGESEPRGVLYDLIRRPGEKRAKGGTEPLKDFAARIESNIKKDPAHYFDRLKIEYTAHDRQHHRDRARTLVTAFYQWWKGASGLIGRDPLYNHSMCETKYGPCSELRICANGDRSGHRVRAVPSPELA